MMLKLATDHINKDKQNDSIDNLQVLGAKLNRTKGAIHHKTYEALITYSRSKKGRARASKTMTGDGNPNASFPEKDIEIIRKKYSLGSMSRLDIRKKYNVSDRAVRNMLTGVSYSHISGSCQLRRGK